MLEFQPACDKEHAVQAEEALQKVIVPLISVRDVSEDRMGSVLQMPPDLVPPPRLRESLDQGVAARRIPASRMRNLTAIERPNQRDRCLSLVVAARLSGQSISMSLQRDVDCCLVRRVSADDREVLFSHGVF